MRKWSNESKRAKPQLKQKIVVPAAPIRQRKVAMTNFEYFCPKFESWITTTVPSTMAKAESIPNENKVRKRSKHQKLGEGIVLIAAGKAMNARPVDEILFCTGELIPTR